MANIVILGAGVMGSALTVPATDNQNDVVLVGTHLDESIIDSLKQSRYHPTLDEALSESITPLHYEELSAAHLDAADIVVLGVSSAGVDWAVNLLARLDRPISVLSLVTKGLESAGTEIPLTYAHALPAKLEAAGVACGSLIGIGGPCIAREIVVRQPTAVVYATAHDDADRDRFASCMQTPEYRVFKSGDIIGVEACAALKNFLAIGVSAMIGRYKMESGARSANAKNPTSAVFNQAVREMAALSVWMGGNRDTAFDHAGMGDLHVTVGGGRNSRLGECLGQGLTLQQALDGPMAGQTVEGKDTGRVLAKGLHSAFDQGGLQVEDFPLTQSILRAIESNSVYEFDFRSLG